MLFCTWISNLLKVLELHSLSSFLAMHGFVPEDPKAKNNWKTSSSRNASHLGATSCLLDWFFPLRYFYTLIDGLFNLHSVFHETTTWRRLVRLTSIHGIQNLKNLASLFRLFWSVWSWRAKLDKMRWRRQAHAAEEDAPPTKQCSNTPPACCAFSVDQNMCSNSTVSSEQKQEKTRRLTTSS